ncbi:MAG TPA: ATP-binding protein, partial [Sphaerochaeta sp.]|nr:ATP-binding protein [Sphaerochaeta sp.]
MGKRYRFERMHLSRSPGFRSPPFGTLDSFSPGLNILYGPNGIGKSSLIRAMRALLTKTKDGSFIDAEAIVKGEKERWVLSLDHGQLSQIRGESGERSTLPGRNDTLSDAYFFGLHELLTEVGDNPVFVTRVQSEMQGGIDLEAARTKSEAKSRFSLASIGESQRAIKARKAVQELKSSIAAQSSLFEE